MDEALLRQKILDYLKRPVRGNKFRHICNVLDAEPEIVKPLLQKMQFEELIRFQFYPTGWRLWHDNEKMNP